MPLSLSQNRTIENAIHSLEDVIFNEIDKLEESSDKVFQTYKNVRRNTNSIRQIIKKL